MTNHENELFNKIQILVNELNYLLDEALRLHEKSQLDGSFIGEVTTCISYAHQKQLKLQGFNKDDG